MAAERFPVPANTSMTSLFSNVLSASSLEGASAGRPGENEKEPLALGESSCLTSAVRVRIRGGDLDRSTLSQLLP